MRIRTIKAEYWQHEMHAGLSREASILGAAITNLADDEGRGDALPARVRGLLVPCIEMDAGRTLKELEGIDFVILYEAQVDGVRRRLFQVTTFLRHQSISHPTPSVLPPPPGWVFRLDPKPADWKKGVWRRGRWYREGSEAVLAMDKMAVAEGSGMVPNGLTECSGSLPGVFPDGSNERCGSVPGEVAEDSSYARARTGTGTGTGTGTRKGQGKGVGTREGVVLTDGEVGLLRSLAADGCVEQSSVEQSEVGSPGVSPSQEAASGAEIPSETEVVAAGAVAGVDGAYAGRFWRQMTNTHGWVRNRRLVRWRNILAERWGEDRSAWLEGRMSGSPYKKNGAGAEAVGDGALSTGRKPFWRALEDLEKAIGEHPANKGSTRYEPRCSRVQRAQLAELEEELARMKAQGLRQPLGVGAAE